MQKLKNLALIGALSASFMACEKTDEAVDSSFSPKSTVDYPYEIYTPATGDAYAEMKAGLLDAFNSSNGSNTIDLNKTVFLMEAGLSTLFTDEGFVDYEGTFEENIALEFTRDGSLTTMGELKTNFSQVFNSIGCYPK